MFVDAGAVTWLEALGRGQAQGLPGWRRVGGGCRGLAAWNFPQIVVFRLNSASRCGSGGAGPQQCESWLLRMGEASLAVLGGAN